MSLIGHSAQPIRISAMEIIRHAHGYAVRTTSGDGAVGIAPTSKLIEIFFPIMAHRIAPFFVGKDARKIESLLGDLYRHKSNYKLSGQPFWACVAWAELSILDLLGKVHDQPVAALFGTVTMPRVPVYLSSLRRDTTPEEQVDLLGARLAETGCRAVKMKIGGRMSDNADAAPGRTEQLVARARRELGDEITIYADANGSYDAARAVEIGTLLEDHGIGFFEEPCPFDDYAQTREVAAALTIPVAGGEQEASFARFRELVDTRVVDIVQPDPVNTGGLIRALRVARLAADAGRPVVIHAPKAGPLASYMLHLASIAPGLGPYQEFGASLPKAGWFTPALEVSNGHVEVPTGPGLGIEIDPDLLRKARPFTGVRARTISSTLRSMRQLVGGWR